MNSPQTNLISEFSTTPEPMMSPPNKIHSNYNENEQEFNKKLKEEKE